jgi:hypothetical protein
MHLGSCVSIHESPPRAPTMAEKIRNSPHTLAVAQGDGFFFCPKE